MEDAASLPNAKAKTAEGDSAGSRERDDLCSISALEALLFAAGDPLSSEQLTEIFALDKIGIGNLLTELDKNLAARRSGLMLQKVAGGYQLVTRPEYYPVVERLGEVVDKRLTTPALETLAIIAFKQPITKGEIELIRGVRVERSIAKLLELELIEEQGRKKVLGRPILYGTTATFLKCFGLNDLDDLPHLPSFEDAKRGMSDEQLALLTED